MWVPWGWVLWLGHGERETIHTALHPGHAKSWIHPPAPTARPCSRLAPHPTWAPRPRAGKSNPRSRPFASGCPQTPAPPPPPAMLWTPAAGGHAALAGCAPNTAAQGPGATPGWCTNNQGAHHSVLLRPPRELLMILVGIPCLDAGVLESRGGCRESAMISYGWVLMKNHASRPNHQKTLKTIYHQRAGLIWWLMLIKHLNLSDVCVVNWNLRTDIYQDDMW